MIKARSKLLKVKYIYLLYFQNEKNNRVLTEEDIEFLVQNTEFNEKDIREWFREFLMDCPSGVLTREKVFEMLSVSLPAENGKIVADLIFSTFDKDKNNFIDFNEFIIATHCTANSSPEDKLRWVFQLYDKVSIEQIVLFQGVWLEQVAFRLKYQ